ncbi:hypothetical protein IU487_29120 [Nocardia puris]|uniref:hypothetical protein n=1 Tax=Nocardia puris TaxID=208602 RepID=UPI001895A2B6|nr:hypothetical protein [Nocardia puris]MBF6215068.1 hypothetical protein [Nocardia puris]
MHITRIILSAGTGGGYFGRSGQSRELPKLFAGEFEQCTDARIRLAQLAHRCDRSGLLAAPSRDFGVVLAFQLFDPLTELADALLVYAGALSDRSCRV